MQHKDTYNKILNTLCCSYETGEGAVNLSEKFIAKDILFQLDVIGDWIYDLEFYRDLVLLEPDDEALGDEGETLDNKAEIIDLAKQREIKADRDENID